jgi:hypothetical protein
MQMPELGDGLRFLEESFQPLVEQIFVIVGIEDHRRLAECGFLPMGRAYGQFSLGKHEGTVIASEK